MRYLARREYAAAELRDKLVRRGYDGAIVAQVIAQLTEARAQDDDRFIEAFVRSRVGRGQGPVRIGAELRQRGIPDEQVDAALATAADWRAQARDARAARFGAGPPGDWSTRGKQARFLEQRGFTHEQIRAALDGDE
ncbi:MAG: recombination regulator RecX [Xanthomonadaceae bacterium]|nr:recombination regulator RecX [Xanthomonadaceae bacterium]